MQKPLLRIASLISSATEILYGLGLGDSVVGVSHECDYPPQAAAKPRLTHSNVNSEQASGDIDDQVKDLFTAGAALYEFDRDALSELRPDVIVTQAQCDVCAVRYTDVIEFVRNEPALSNTRVIALNPTSLADVLNDVTRLGQALNVVDRAQEYVDTLQTRVDAVRETTEKLSADQRPRVVCIEWITPLMLAANWTPELIEWAGGRCPLTKAGEHSGYTDWQSVVDVDPEVIIVSPCGFDLPRTIDEAAPIFEWPRFSELSASRTGNVYAVDGNAYLNRSGPRLVDSLEILAHLFHPGAFPVVASSGWKQLSRRSVG